MSQNLENAKMLMLKREKLPTVIFKKTEITLFCCQRDAQTQACTVSQTHVYLARCDYVCLCVSVLSEVSSAGRNSHPARSKQRPLVMLDPGVWVTGRLSRGERKPGGSKITLLCPDMTVNWAQGIWVSRLPRLHSQLVADRYGPITDLRML